MGKQILLTRQKKKKKKETLSSLAPAIKNNSRNTEIAVSSSSSSRAWKPDCSGNCSSIISGAVSSSFSSSPSPTSFVKHCFLFSSHYPLSYINILTHTHTHIHHNHAKSRPSLEILLVGAPHTRPALYVDTFLLIISDIYFNLEKRKKRSEIDF